MDFAKIISTRRKELHLTQKELAERLNISDKTISRWESGVQIPDAAIIPKLAKELELSIGELYGEEKIDQNLENSNGYQQKKNNIALDIISALSIGFSFLGAIYMNILDIFDILDFSNLMTLFSVFSFGIALILLTICIALKTKYESSKESIYGYAKRMGLVLLIYIIAINTFSIHGFSPRLNFVCTIYYRVYFFIYFGSIVMFIGLLLLKKRVSGKGIAETTKSKLEIGIHILAILVLLSANITYFTNGFMSVITSILVVISNVMVYIDIVKRK